MTISAESSRRRAYLPWDQRQRRLSLSFSPPARRLVVACGLLAALTLLFFLPLLRGDTFHDVAARRNELYPWAASPVPAPAPTLHYDEADTFYPWQVFLNRAARSHELPLWNPYSFSGEPFFANGQNGILYPPRTFFSLILPAHRVHDALLITHMFLGGVMMYLLLTSVPLCFGAALFGAIVWMLNSFMLAWMALEHYVIIEAWLPLLLLLVGRAVHRRSWRASVGLGVVLALVFLGANILFVELVVVTLGGYAGYLMVRRVWNAVRQRAWRVAGRQMVRDGMILSVPVALCVGLIAVQLLPTLALTAEMSRTALPYQQLLLYRLPPSELVHIVRQPSLYTKGIPWIVDGALEVYHEMLFLGTAAALLALIGLWRTHPLANFARWLAIGTLLVACGTPATWLAYHLLPGFSSLKPLGRILFLFDFAAAILAAFGMDSLLRRLPRVGGWGWGQKVQRCWRMGVVILLGLTVVGQMYQINTVVNRHQSANPASLYPETRLIHLLAADPTTRMLPTWPAFFGSTFLPSGIMSGSGYDSLVPDRIANLWQVIEGNTPESVFLQGQYSAFQAKFLIDHLRYDLLPRVGITDLVTPPGTQPAKGTSLGVTILKQAYAGQDGDIFQVVNALPNAYVVHACEEMPTDKAALQRFADPAFDPTLAVLVETAYMRSAAACQPQATSIANRTAETAVVTERTLNTLVLHVEAKNAGWLVINESYDDGWIATVDGVATVVTPGNYAFRTLPISAGGHTVVLRYHPRTYGVGRAISAVTLGLLLTGFLAMSIIQRRCRARANR